MTGDLMQHHPLVAVALFTLCSVAGLATFAWQVRRTRALLDRWAATSGFRIVARHWRVWRTGPYRFRSTDAQWVFYVTVEDASGRRRSGYARVGGFFLGLMSDAVAVTWDDER